jgi:predicted ATPase/DNA-binding winged helix-turn-helix (wHTH) protein
VFPDAEISRRAAAPTDDTVLFGPFRLLAAQQLLLRGDTPLNVGSRALDILIALVDRAGELVTKSELISRAWPSTVVDEANLRAQIAGVRKALGDGTDGARYIATVPGRGYRFVAPVSRAIEADKVSGFEPSRLPIRLTRPIGRTEVIAAIAGRLRRGRLITVVGPGGIGKTTVTLAVAEELSGSYEHGVCFIDLSSLADPLFVPGLLAGCLGVASVSADPTTALIGFLQSRRMLILLDNCEHLVEATAVLVEKILKGAPGIHILATSREPLRAEAEGVLRLPPLEVPAASEGLTAAAALTYPAVQLFVERASSSAGGYELSDTDAPVVAELCRRLDGIALAIELAAARVDAFGVHELASLLADRFRLLSRGRATALPRHQTLNAALDWSYEYLPPRERLALNRLAVFAGRFTLDAACAVIAEGEITTHDVPDLVANLVARSLVQLDVRELNRGYRLLETTRDYANGKLRDSGEHNQIACAHARYFCQLFERAEREANGRPIAEWLAIYGPQLANVRGALDWTFSSDGDPALGTALTIAALPLWFQLSLIDECRRDVERALQAADSAGPDALRRRMKLYAALGWSLMYTTVPDRETGAAWATALELAEGLGDTDYQLRALWGLWAGRMNNGEFRSALDLARKFYRVAEAQDSDDRLIGDRMTGASLHFLGDQSAARKHIERMLAEYVTPVHGADIVRFQFDQRVTASITLARVLWLQGFPDRAMALVKNIVESAISGVHALSLSNALAQAACPIALYVGDLEAAEHFTALLSSNTARLGLDIWRVYCAGFQGQLALRRGDNEGGLRLLRTTVVELRHARFVQYHTAFLAALAEALISSNQVQFALAAIEEALARSEDMDERWCLPELLRIRGEALLRSGPQRQAEAEECFRRALDIAHQQGALSWELRAAASLSRLLANESRPTEGHDLLTAIRDRFDEGFESVDMKSAEELLRELSISP